MALLNGAGVLLVLLLVVGVGLFSGRRVKTAADFDTGGARAGPWMICGAIMGALVSSQASIGTAQLAFHYGLSAWWFTLGAGLGCLILALGYAQPLRSSGAKTLADVLGREYGPCAACGASLLSSIGVFISALAQVVACAGLLTVIFPVPFPAAALLSALLMGTYVVFGGAWGVGMGGIVKLLLLYAACLATLAAVMAYGGGPDGVFRSVRLALEGTALGAVSGAAGAPEMEGRYLSLLARGAAKDLGSGVSLLLGVLSTQTYAQAVWSGKSDQAARRGAILAACLIPPVGAAGIAVGMFMRGRFVTQAEADALLAAGEALPQGMGILSSTLQVFPTFVVHYLPVFFSGMVLGTLLITVVGGGAGLSLGMATTLVNDIFKKVSKRLQSPAAALAATRGTIVAVLVAAVAIACAIPAATINDYGFLSMGLRGAVVFVPLTTALFLPGRVPRRCALLCLAGGPAGVLTARLAHSAVDPLFIGIGVASALALAGSLYTKKRPLGR